MTKLIMPAAIAAMLAAPLVPHAFSAPPVEIRLPERFRLISDQLFDLRVEAAGLADLGAEVIIIVNGQAASLPAPEVTTDNDTDPATLDKAWTYRGLSFQAGVLFADRRFCSGWFTRLLAACVTSRNKRVPPGERTNPLPSTILGLSA